MGINIGTIPTIQITVKPDNQKLKGIILISPFNRKKIQKYKKDYEDVFSNDILHKIVIPIFLIHGKSDSVVNYNESMELANALKCFSWFPQNGTHNKTIQLCRKKFLYKIYDFIENISYNNKPRSRTQSTDFTKHNSTDSSVRDFKLNESATPDKNVIKEGCNSTKKLCVIIDETSNYHFTFSNDYLNASKNSGLNSSSKAKKMENDFTNYVKM